LLLSILLTSAPEGWREEIAIRGFLPRGKVVVLGPFEGIADEEPRKGWGIELVDVIIAVALLLRRPRSCAGFYGAIIAGRLIFGLWIALLKFVPLGSGAPQLPVD
jgi:hypothetical protein